MKPLNIREIAQICNLSTATVSRYINNTGKVSQAKSEIIQGVLDQYDYHPNKLTNAIFTGFSNDIGVIVQNIMNPFFAELMNELEKAAEIKGYNLVICNANSDQAKETKYYHELISKRVAGILVINTTDETIYSKAKRPIVGVEKRIGNGVKIITDNALGINLVFEQILNHDVEKMLFIKGPDQNYSSNRRCELFEKAANAQGINYEIAQICNEFNELELIEQMDFQQFDSVFCWNDLVAHSVCGQINQQGLAIPQDVQVIGFDGLTINKIFPYALTTVVQDYRNIAKQAIEQIEKLMQEEQCEDIFVPVDLYIGNTSRVAKDQE